MLMLAVLSILCITTVQACTDGAKTRDPIDCASYLLCSNNTESLVTCQNNKYFNPGTKACEAGLPDSQICIEDGNYTAQGVMTTDQGLPLYVAGSGSKIVIWNYAIGGMMMGRTKMLADLVASFGYHVIIPDYYRGQGANPGKMSRKKIEEFAANESQWTNLKKDLDDIIMPYAVKNGGKTFYSVGTCWGSFLTVMLGGYTYKGNTTFSGGVSMHPSHPGIVAGIVANNLTEQAVMKAITAPQLFLNSVLELGGITDICGLDKELMGDMLTIVNFPDMKHGFTVTGNASDANDNRDTKKALNLLKDFLAAPKKDTSGTDLAKVCATEKPTEKPTENPTTAASDGDSSDAAAMGGQTVLLTVLMLAAALALKY